MTRHRVEFGYIGFPTMSIAHEWIKRYMDGQDDGALVQPDVMELWMAPLFENHPDRAEVLRGWTGEVLVRNWNGRKAPIARLVMDRDWVKRTGERERDISLIKCLKGSVVAPSPTV